MSEAQAVPYAAQLEAFVVEQAAFVRDVEAILQSTTSFGSPLGSPGGLGASAQTAGARVTPATDRRLSDVISKVVARMQEFEAMKPQLSRLPREVSAVVAQQGQELNDRFVALQQRGVAIAGDGSVTMLEQDASFLASEMERFHKDQLPFVEGAEQALQSGSGNVMNANLAAASLGSTGLGNSGFGVGGGGFAAGSTAVHLVHAVLMPEAIVRFPEITEICERLESHPGELPEAAASLVSALCVDMRSSAKALTIINELLYLGCSSRTLSVFKDFGELPEVLAGLRCAPNGYGENFEAARILANEILCKVRPHDFEPRTFTAPTWCTACGEFLWGISEQGGQCKLCPEVRCFSCCAKTSFCQAFALRRQQDKTVKCKKDKSDTKRKVRRSSKLKSSSCSRSPSRTQDGRKTWGVLRGKLDGFDASSSVADFQEKLGCSQSHAKRLRKRVCC